MTERQRKTEKCFQWLKEDDSTSRQIHTPYYLRNNEVEFVYKGDCKLSKRLEHNNKGKPSNRIKQEVDMLRKGSKFSLRLQM